MLVQFRNAVDDNNQNGANLCYVTAMGLITGATVSGGLGQTKGNEMLTTLDDTRAAFEASFREFVRARMAVEALLAVQPFR